MSNVTASELDQLGDPSRDPVVTDSDKYKVLLENESVRVLEYRDSPGDRTSPHHHSDFVLCALSTFRRKFLLTGAREVVREVRLREAAWSTAQSHIGENVGSTDTHAIIVELK